MNIRKEVPIQACVNYHNFDPLKSVFNLETHFNNKPKKAVWTSDYYDGDIRQIGWIIWNILEYFGEMDQSLLKPCLYKLYPKKNLKVLELDTLEDVYELPLTSTFNETFEELKFNYKKMAKQGYDGLHITWKGAELGHTSHMSWTIALAMGAFDCESTVWFHNDWIDKAELVDSNLIQTLKDME